MLPLCCRRYQFDKDRIQYRYSVRRLGTISVAITSIVGGAGSDKIPRTCPYARTLCVKPPNQRLTTSYNSTFNHQKRPLTSLLLRPSSRQFIYKLLANLNRKGFIGRKSSYHLLINPSIRGTVPHHTHHTHLFPKRPYYCIWYPHNISQSIKPSAYRVG